MINYQNIRKKYLPENSLFGLKILNSFQSILFAYLLIFYQIIITSFFGNQGIEVLSAICFILLVNISIIILVINSLIRIPGHRLYYFSLELPLLVYIPFSIKKIFLCLSFFINLVFK